jgi:hypothetical protein
MTPIGTVATDIDEVIILRGKRMASNVRQNHSSFDNRQAQREWYCGFLDKYPILPDRIMRFVDHLRGLFGATEADERQVLDRGYF